ncbi:MAG: hypothetical protein IPM42_05705 [Saprospiraceae bacterium]|nr:hypothetical protein [Saprospiraceae bacterium]
MNKKWKTAFWASFSINIIMLFGGAFILLTNTITSGNNYDNLITIAEDLDHISKAISKKAYTIDQFDNELVKINAGHWTEKENNLIRFQIVNLLFDDKGDFSKIETYYRERENK